MNEEKTNWGVVFLDLVIILLAVKFGWWLIILTFCTGSLVLNKKRQNLDS